ncbi:MAG: hypothetical protein HKUEN02_12350 [Anaerolineaceae bacterium]|nr:MAG: hypothetical protein HKUEN02_12350 [Anaerolineaceae bacterium]
MKAIKNTLREFLKYPSAIIGIGVILLLLGVSAYALATIPYKEAVRLWRGGEDVWYQNPKYAAPAWFNYFSKVKKPVSFKVNTMDGDIEKTVTVVNEHMDSVDMTYSFDYDYEDRKSVV